MLGPHLFLICINSIPDSITTNIVIYTDNLTMEDTDTNGVQLAVD